MASDKPFFVLFESNPDLTLRIHALPLEQIEALAEALLDFTGPATSRPGRQLTPERKAHPATRKQRPPQAQGSVHFIQNCRNGSLATPGRPMPRDFHPSDQAHPHPAGELLTYWRKSDGCLLGDLNAHPDHWKQGDGLENLKEQLLDLVLEFTKNDLPGSHRVSELVVI